MRTIIYVLFIHFAVSFSGTADQTDWSGGDGVSGPVVDWEESYDNSIQIDITSGTLKLNLAILPTPVEQTIDAAFDGAYSVYAADIDGDGDTDVLGAVMVVDDITWWENNDTGSGIYWTEHTVDVNFDGASSVYAADIDGDGDTDILGAAEDADEITWWENADGAGTAWVEYTINGTFDGAYSVCATDIDIDGDGDVDVLGAATVADDILWWENTDGAGIIWVKHTIDSTFDSARSVYTADINGDGDMDVLGAALLADDIAWWDMFFFNLQEPTNTSVAFQLRSSSDAADMGSWSDTIFTSGAGLSGILTDSTQYLQYRVILDTSDPSNTPVLEDVMFSYSTYVSTEENSSGDITSWALLPPENPSYGFYSAMITVPEPRMVELALYDVSGRVVAESSQEFPIGTHSVIFDGIAEGVYFCAMRAGE